MMMIWQTLHAGNASAAAAPCVLAYQIGGTGSIDDRVFLHRGVVVVYIFRKLIKLIALISWCFFSSVWILFVCFVVWFSDCANADFAWQTRKTRREARVLCESVIGTGENNSLIFSLQFFFVAMIVAWWTFIQHLCWLCVYVCVCVCVCVCVFCFCRVFDIRLGSCVWLVHNWRIIARTRRKRWNQNLRHFQYNHWLMKYESHSNVTYFFVLQNLFFSLSLRQRFSNVILFTRAIGSALLFLL